MKKKLLSLVLAGAMVASTSVSAFADTVVNKNDGTANVTINGSVDNNDGQPATGTISVTVPTALNFRVDKDGTVSGGSIKVVNNGIDTVDVTAVKFYDTTPNSKITVKLQNDLQSSDDRSNLVLSIGGNLSERAFFKSEGTTGDKNGIYSASGNNETNGIKVSTIGGNGQSDTLTLNGFAGQADLSGEEGITDEFTLTLKITKVNN